jgi:Xaa-Pro aminopeptidase
VLWEWLKSKKIRKMMFKRKLRKEDNMSNIVNERYKYPIPTRELERRWSLIRKAMKEQGVDCLIMQNDQPFLAGYVRYFMDLPANGYKTTVIFPVDEDMTVINHGGWDDPPAPPDWAARGIKNRIMRPYVQVLHSTNTLAAEAAVKFIKDKKYGRVGLVCMDTLSAAFYKYLTENLKGAEIIDASDLVDEVKAIKSEDEIAVIKKAVELHDVIAEAVPSIFKPGRYEFEIRSEIMKIAADQGSEEQNVMVGSDAVTARLTPPIFENRKIQPGDSMVCLIEVSGPGGFFGELARTWCLGEPPKELIDAFDAAMKAQKLVADMLKPGANPGDLLKANNDFLTSKGYLPEGRLFGHSQGYDMVERPAFIPSETMKIKENMFVAVHPVAANDKAFAFCCDNYLITADGAELLTKTPQKVFIGLC